MPSCLFWDFWAQNKQQQGTRSSSGGGGSLLEQGGEASDGGGPETPGSKSNRSIRRIGRGQRIRPGRDAVGQGAGPRAPPSFYRNVLGSRRNCILRRDCGISRRIRVCGAHFQRLQLRWLFPSAQEGESHHRATGTRRHRQRPGFRLCSDEGVSPSSGQED